VGGEASVVGPDASSGVVAKAVAFRTTLRSVEVALLSARRRPYWPRRWPEWRPRATRSTARMFGFHEVEHRVPKGLVRGLVVDRRRRMGGRGGRDVDGSATGR
jgi:hypothetical protein